MVNHHFAITSEILVKNILISMLTPPLAELPVPLARQDIEELLITHANQREEVLVAKMSFEMELIT
jgi:hypothetical protein